MYLCQVNVSRIAYSVRDPRFLKFNAGAKLINRKMHTVDGFIAGDQIYDGNELFITRSVWRTPQSLVAFVNSGLHLKFMREAANWFSRPSQPTLALWYSNSDTLPDHRFCLQQLATLQQQGESERLMGAQWLANYS